MAQPASNCRTFAAFLAVLATGGALALRPQDPARSPAQGGTRIGSGSVPTGTVPWQLLQSAESVQKADRKSDPLFPREVKELDRQHVRLYGFMMPLDFTFEPIIVAGRLAVLGNDVAYHRLTNAGPIKP